MGRFDFRTRTGLIFNIIQGQQGSSPDVDAQAFIDRVITAGGTLSIIEKSAVDKLVTDLKSAGIWNLMKAIYPMVGASAASCSQNLKSSSFIGTFTSGWTFATTGVTPNGTSAYMNTGIIPSVSLSQNSKHISSYVRTTANNSIIGAGSTSTNVYDQIVQLGGTLYGNISTNFSGVARSATTGFYLVRRILSTTANTFINNVLVQTDGLTSTGQPPNAIFLSARNVSSADLYSSSECAFSSIGDGLTDTQVSDFYTAVQAFQTTLSRQV